MTEYIDDPRFDGTLEEVRDHYRRLEDVYDTLATLGAEYPTLGFAGNSGWYVTRDEHDVDAIEAGWDGRARCRTLEKDLRGIIEEQLGADDRAREVFNISSWKAPDAPYEWRRYRETDDGREWEDGEKPTPNYDDIRGFGFWCDLDLADKAGRIDLSEDELAAVEKAQARIIEEVADLYGVDDGAVYGLDSGGGAYVYGPPEVAIPIAEMLDADDRALFLEDMGKRMREDFLGARLEKAIAEVDGAADLLDPDWVQNSNRQTKAPGAIHHDHDLVVTPLRERDPETGEVAGPVNYEPTRVSEFDEDDVESLEAWARGLTAIEHKDAVETFVRNLYPDLSEDADGWQEIVTKRVTTLREEQERRGAVAEERRAYLEEWAAEEGTADSIGRPGTDSGSAGSGGAPLRTESGAYEGSGIVTDKAELEAAIDTIDVRDVVRDHACDSWNTSSRSHETTFDPSWRESSSGKSCAIPNGENTFIDNNVDAGGGPVKAYALGEGLINSATDGLSGVYGEALGAMRADGYNIPVWVPEADDEYEKTPFGAVKRGAVALGVLAPDEFVERETDDGETYLGFPDAETYNEALTALEEEGINHGREVMETPTRAVYETPERFTRERETDDAEDDDLPSTSPTDPAGNLSEHDGCYGYWNEYKHDGERVTEWAEATNFLLETVEFVETDAEEKVRIRVHPAHPREGPYEVTVEPKVFNESRSFREEVVTGRTTTFTNVDGNALNDLRQTVGAQEAPTRTGVSHVGAAAEDLAEWVTPEGVLTADGWADSPRHKYYAQASSDSGDESIVGEKWMLSPEDGDQYDVEAARTAIELLPRSRLAPQAIATLGWFYSAPAKPLIHNREGEFNHLHVRGKTESGKTSYLELLAEAFGMKPSPWGAEATNFSLEQLHVGSRGAPVWIDEYKPSDMHQRTVKKLHRFLRIATREGVHTKGRPDQSFMTFRLQSPVCLSGEQQVSEPAVRRRMLQVNLSERATELPAHVEAYSELAGEPYEDDDGTTQTPAGIDLSEHALAYYRFLLSRDAEELTLLWDSSRDATGRILDDLGLSLQDSEFQAAQTVVFGYRLYRRFAESLGVPDGRLPAEDALHEAVEHLCGNVGANGQRREHGDEFLELLAQASHAGYLHGPDDGTEDTDDAPAFRVYDPDSTPDEALAVHMPTAYPAVKRYARDYNVEDEYNLLSKSDYTDEFADLAAADDSHVVATNHTVRMGSRKRCLVLDPYKTREKLGTNFDLSAFGLVPEEEAADPASAPPEEDDEQLDTSLADLDPGRHTEIVAEFGGQLEPKPWLEEEGWLQDGEFALDYRVREGRGQGNPMEGVGDGATVRVTNATVKTDDDGLRYIEITPRCDVEVLEGVGAEDGDDDGDETDADPPADGPVSDGEPDPAPGSDDAPAAADGGQATPNGEGVRADAERVEAALREAGAVVGEGRALSTAAVAGRVDLAPDRVRMVLRYSRTERGTVAKGDFDEWRVRD